MERWELVFNEATGRHEIGTPDAIPYCQFAEVSGEERATLMHAAPDLLGALEDIIGTGPDRWGYGAAANAMDDTKRARACAAINKAKGKS